MNSDDDIRFHCEVQQWWEMQDQDSAWIETQLNRNTNMKVSEMLSGNYLKKEDCGSGIGAVIDKVTKEMVSDPQTGGKVEKNILHFSNDVKPHVLNTTNTLKLAEMFGDETEEWAGKKIVLFNDTNVMYQGKAGGIRIRPFKPREEAKTAAEVEPDFNDDVPF